MEYDDQRIENAVLALLATFSFNGGNTWRGFDFEVMDKLYEQGFITQPKGRAKSVWLTPEGLERGRQLARLLFGPQPSD